MLTGAILTALRDCQERLPALRADDEVVAKAEEILTIARKIGPLPEPWPVDRPRRAALRRQGTAAVIVDTSALMALINREADAESYAEALAGAHSPAISAATFLETAVVVDARRDPAASRQLDSLMRAAALEVVDVTYEPARVARDAFRDFGKGSGHPARPTFGDCFAYALASVREEPLLFNGDDFVHTDITPALT
jgi:ribonuclease VapC